MTATIMAANSRPLSSVDGFGEALRQERQRRSVSLEDISQTTKVTVRNLQALESDAFEKLPGGILGKGIVRSYVRYLGLDEGEWVARFLDASGQRPGNEQAENDWAAFALTVSTNRVVPDPPDTRLRWAGVAVLLLLLAGFGWVVWGYVHQRMASLRSRPALSYSASAGTGAALTHDATRLSTAAFSAAAARAPSKPN